MRLSYLMLNKKNRETQRVKLKTWKVIILKLQITEQFTGLAFIVI